jgi:hypothetical protein
MLRLIHFCFRFCPGNPLNPDPAKIVQFGPQSWHEMMIGYFEVATDRGNGLRQLLTPTP